MAYYNEDDEENLNEEPGGVSTGPESSVISGQSGVSAPSSPQQANAPDKASNFVGIRDYLNANKSQAQKLGDQTANVINTSANQARTDVGSLQNEADQKITGVNSLDDNTKSLLSNNAENLTGDQRNQIKSTQSAKYTGPKNEMDFGDTYNNAAKSTQTATQNIDNSGTEQGRMNLITQVNNKPRTQGMNVFDNALLQAGGGREKLANAANANKDVKGSLDQTSQNIRGKIGRMDDPSTPDVDESSGAMGQTSKAQADAYKSVQDAMNAWQSGFQPKVKNAQDSLLSQQNAITGDLGNDMYSMDQGTMDMLGLNPGQYSYNLDFNNYLNKVSPDQINAGNVADQTDYARYAALADLGGVSPQEMILKQENAGQAGTAPKFSANKEKLAQDLAAAEAASNQKFQVGNTVADQTNLFNNMTAAGNPVSTNDADLRNWLSSLEANANQGWLTDAKAGNGGNMGTNYRNIVNFLSDLDKNRQAIKKNA